MGEQAMRRVLGLAVVPALAVIVVAGCGGGGKAFPTGKWTATNEKFGVVEMDYRSDGTWLVSIEGKSTGTGKFSTDGNTVKFETDSICSAMGAEQGTYTWTNEDNQLTLTKKADECEFRVGILDGVVSAQVK
jgi:hypothetical protein